MVTPSPDTWALLFFMLVLGGWFVEAATLVLDIRRLRTPLPPAVRAWIDTGTWHNMQAYTQATHRTALLESTIGVGTLGLFWFFEGFNRLNHFIMAWQWGPITTGVVYLGTLTALSYLVNLPFTVYGLFHLEARFGFNRATLATFVTDQIKMVVLTVVLGGPFLAGVLALFYHAGPNAWLYGWVGAVLFSICLNMLVPRWILPLFNRFSPLPEGALRRAILTYADSVHFSVAAIFEMDGSRRSSKANAFVTGFGKSRRIALFDTLIENHSVEELVAVLAHEIGHAKKKHVLKKLILGMLHMGVLFYLLSLCLAWPSMYQGFFMEGTPLHAGLLFFGILMGPMDLIVGPCLKAISRHFEFEADRFAMETSPHPGALASALKKLARGNLSNLNPHPFYVMLHHGHPPLLARLAAMPPHTSLKASP